MNLRFSQTCLLRACRWPARRLTANKVMWQCTFNYLGRPMQVRSSNTLASIRAMTGLCMSGFFLFGIGVYSFTQFLEPLAHEFGWGRAGLGGLMSAFWLSAPFAVPAAYLLRGWVSVVSC